MFCPLLQAGASGRAASLVLWSRVEKPIISSSRQVPLLGGVPTMPLAPARSPLPCPWPPPPQHRRARCQRARCLWLCLRSYSCVCVWDDRLWCGLVSSSIALLFMFLRRPRKAAFANLAFGTTKRAMSMNNYAEWTREQKKPDVAQLCFLTIPQVFFRAFQTRRSNLETGQQYIRKVISMQRIRIIHNGRWLPELRA